MYDERIHSNTLGNSMSSVHLCSNLKASTFNRLRRSVLGTSERAGYKRRPSSGRLAGTRAGRGVRALPSDGGATLVLALEPLVEGLEVLEQRAGVHLARPAFRQQGDGVRPLAGLAQREDIAKQLPSLRGIIEVASVQWTVMFGFFAHGFVKLELHHRTREVPYIGNAA